MNTRKHLKIIAAVLSITMASCASSPEASKSSVMRDVTVIPKPSPVRSELLDPSNITYTPWKTENNVMSRLVYSGKTATDPSGITCVQVGPYSDTGAPKRIMMIGLGCDQLGLFAVNDLGHDKNLPFVKQHYLTGLTHQFKECEVGYKNAYVDINVYLVSEQYDPSEPVLIITRTKTGPYKTNYRIVDKKTLGTLYVPPETEDKPCFMSAYTLPENI